jgi:hypothetical protein
MDRGRAAFQPLARLATFRIGQIMVSRIAPSRALGRLISALLLLSVLLTTLGWAHPSCDGSADRQGSATPRTEHAGMMAAGHDAGLPDDGAAPHASDGCPQHDRQGRTGSAACALMAHCVTAAVATAPIVPAPQVRLLTSPSTLTDSRPLETSYPPESPPPKV